MKEDNKQNEIQLRISGMTCDSCALHVRNALEGVEGVISIDLPSWKSEFVGIVARSTVTDKELTDAVREAGYVAETKHRAETLQKLVVPVTPRTTGYDIVVIDTESAGMAAAIRSSELGYEVALIEGATIGVRV